VQAIPKTLVVLFILAFGGLLSAPCAQAAVSITPEALNVAGYRGSSQIRHILLQSDAEQAINQLTPISLDLNRLDGQTILSADALQLKLPADSLAPGEAIKAPLQVDLAQATSSGQFQGTLLLKYQGGQQTLPITVHVKERPWWPLLTLIVGVLIGTTLSGYRAQGFTRDEITLQLGRLRTQLRSDRTVPEPFANRIQAYLIDVETSLTNQVWATAKAQLGEAQTLWNNWQKGRDDWLAELDYYQTLKAESESILGSETFYGKAVAANLKDLYRQIPDYQQPHQLEDQLDGIRQQIDRFQQGQAKVDALSTDQAQLIDPEQQTLWSLKVQDLQQQLYNLNPASDEAFQTWLQAAKGLTDELFQTLQAQAQVGVRGPAMVRSAPAQVTAVLAPPPVAIPGSQLRPMQFARWRLRLFNWSSRSVAILVLSWAGFAKLYLSQPNFGAQPVSDYVALLAWGFGAEVTRESLTKVLQSFGANPNSDTDEGASPKTDA
jgi:hypothetical protein